MSRRFDSSTVHLRSYLFSVAALLAPAALAQPSSFGPRVRLDPMGGAARAVETTVAAGSNCRAIAGWNDFRFDPDASKLGVAFTNNAGLTWTELVVPAAPGQPDSGAGEPMSVFDVATGNLWIGGCAITTTGTYPGFVLAKLNASGTAVEAPKFIPLPGADRGTMAAGRIQGPPNDSRLYIASWGDSPSGLHSYLLRSADSTGDNWGPKIDLNVAMGESVNLARPAVGPAGDVYICYHSGGYVRFARSFTNNSSGVTLNPPVNVAKRKNDFFDISDKVPGAMAQIFYTCIAAGHNLGHVYVAWCDQAQVFSDFSCTSQADLDIFVARSTNHGASWTTTQIALPGDQFLPALTADESGRLHLTFMDAPLEACGARQCDGVMPGHYSNTYAYSADAGATWTTCPLTTTGTPACQCTGSCAAAPWHSGGYDGRAADYIGISAYGGRVYPCYFVRDQFCANFGHPRDYNIYADTICWPEAPNCGN